MKKIEISVVVPVYGCPQALPELHRRLTETLLKITNDYEIILVNDACPMDSWAKVEKICEDDKKVVGLELSRNFGQMKALLAGLDYSSGEWVVMMDCDLQDKPEEILTLYNQAQQGFDSVFARRKMRKDNFLKVFLAKCFYKVYSYATNAKYDPALCNFSISHRKVIDAFCSMRECHRASIMYIQWLGFKTTSVDVDHQERYEGKSSYSLKKRISMAMDILFSQSDKLLKLIAKIGIGIAIIAMISIIFIAIRYLFGNVQPGWTSIVAAIFLMGGLTIATVGVVGIYVGNIFMEVKHRPLYVVRTTLNGTQQNTENSNRSKNSHTADSI